MATTAMTMMTEEGFVTTDPIIIDNGSLIPVEPPFGKCNYYVKNNSVIFFKFSNPYGGIPQNLALNFIGWLVLMSLFAVLRRAAGNYGRLALVRKSDDQDSKWTQIFYAPDDVSTTKTDENEEENAQEAAASSMDYNEVDRKLCSWIWSIFTLSDEKILRKCGSDAIQYLRFQRYLILFVFIITVVCICVILPINFQGELQGTKLDFGHTTISNLSGSDPRLWVHIVVVILFFPLGIWLMRQFSVGLKINEEKESCISSRTLMISGIPRSFCTKEFLHRYFAESYPETEIEDVQIAYDVARLIEMDAKRDRARRAKAYCETRVAKYGAGQQMRPFPCGIICCSCCPSCGQPVDALNFYTKEEIELTEMVEREKARVTARSIGIAFVTFRHLNSAKEVKKDYNLWFWRWRQSGAKPSSLDNEIKPWKWTARFAPPPEDIYWENLDYLSHRLFFIKAFLINFFLFIILFFFTSPAYILSELELFINMNKISESLHLPDKINDFIPTLMLWTLTALLPIIVAYSDWWMGHWRRSVENLWIMRKVFFYLLFMVLVLPSIGLTSLRGFLEFFIHSTEDPGKDRLKWSCIFLPDNGAFFVNYVITCALVGTALEFMRFSELFVYAVRLSFARSVAETPSVRKANLYEFPFGFNYGWMLLVFALTAAYCVVCPLVTVFGLFYMIMKYGVDRYNIYYAYKRSKINKNIHATAVNCVIISLLIQQLILLFFNIVRSSDTSGILSPRAIFSVTMFSIFTFLFIVEIFFHVFKGISPIQYTVGGNNNNNHQQQPSSPPSDFELARRGRHCRKFLPEVLWNDVTESPSGPHNSISVSDSATFDEIFQESPVSSTYGAIRTSPQPQGVWTSPKKFRPGEFRLWSLQLR